MATTRPEASETTGTLRETSGVTAPVTTNSEAVGCAVAAASGKCSGWSTVKRLRSTSGTTLAGGGDAAAASTGRLQPPSIGNTNKQMRKRPLLRILWFIRTRSPLRPTSCDKHASTTERYLSDTQQVESRASPPGWTGETPVPPPYEQGAFPHYVGAPCATNLDESTVHFLWAPKEPAGTVSRRSEYRAVDGL